MASCSRTCSGVGVRARAHPPASSAAVVPHSASPPLPPCFCAVNYISKPTEFLDTYFMVVKGNFRQISYLHVSHHAIMPIIMYILIDLVRVCAGARKAGALPRQARAASTRFAAFLTPLFCVAPAQYPGGNSCVIRFQAPRAHARARARA